MTEKKSDIPGEGLQGKDLRKALEGLLDGLAHGLLTEVDRRSAGELTEQELLLRIRDMLALVAPGAVDVHPPPATPIHPPPRQPDAESPPDLISPPNASTAPKPPSGQKIGLDLDFTGLPGLGPEDPAEPVPRQPPEPGLEAVPELELELEPVSTPNLKPKQEPGPEPVPGPSGDYPPSDMGEPARKTTAASRDIAILDDFSEEPPTFGTLDFDVPETDVPETEVPEIEVPETDVMKIDVPEAGVPKTEPPKPDDPKTAPGKPTTPDMVPPDTAPPDSGPSGDLAPPLDSDLPELEFFDPDTGLAQPPVPAAPSAQTSPPQATPHKDTTGKSSPSPETEPSRPRPAKASAPEKANKVVPIRPAPTAQAASTTPGTPEKSGTRTPDRNGSAAMATATATDLIPRPESKPQKDEPAKTPARRRRPWDPPEGRDAVPDDRRVRQPGGGFKASGPTGFDDVDTDAANAIRGALHVPGQQNGFASTARPGIDDDYAFAQRMAKDLERQTKTRKDPQKAFVLSLAFAGLGDFYGGFPGVGLLFYTPYFALLMLLIINSDWRLLLAMAPLALVSACMSYLNVTSHNRRIDRIKSQTSHTETTRETHFSMKGL